MAGRLNGKPVAARPIGVLFDGGRFAYAFPKEPAIARVLDRP